MNRAFQVEQERGAQRVDIGIWGCLFTKKWQPKLSFTSTFVIFFVLGLIFAGVALFMFILHMRVIEYRILKYDQVPSCISVLGRNETCDIEFRITETIQPPIYFTYELTNFFQNHRRYIQSKSNEQLEGKTITAEEADRSCDPVVRNEDLNARFAWDGKTPLDPRAIANPCGLIAKSFFNDTYELLESNGSRVFINESGIAWLNDNKGKYRRAYKSSQIQWLDPQNQHFIVWMRTAGVPHFSKLWGVISRPLIPGFYKIRVRNNFDIKMYNGHKSIVLTTASAFGGKNIYMPMAYFVISAVCFVVCGIFIYKNRATDGRFGEKRLE